MVTHSNFGAMLANTTELLGFYKQILNYALHTNCAKSIVTRGGGQNGEKGYVVPEVGLPWPEWIKT
jgi:hypothetical protein